MNSQFTELPEPSPRDVERLLDRLVDGELTQAERRELLTRLDSQADGWRRCALAFLEAQAWGSDFRALTELPAKAASVQPAQNAATRGGSWLENPWMSLLAVAASFLMAFGLGTAWRKGQVEPSGPAQVAQQQSPSSSSASAPSAEVASHDATAPTLPRQPLQPRWGTVTVSVDGDQDGVSESVDLPVAAGHGIDEQWLRSQPSALPPQVRRVLERMGHRVRQERQYLPFSLDDGRRVVVPVDEFDVQFIGEQRYQ